MLKFPQKKFKWSGKAQSGFFIDFLIKKFTEVFVRNVFVYSALYFGEKYMVEQLTKKTLDNLIFNSNKYIGFGILNFRLFFYLSLSVVFYTLFFFNLYTFVLL